MKMLFLNACLYWLLVYANATLAQALVKFHSDLVQGGLVSGWTNANSLTVAGQTVTIDSEGRFVFGLGRDAKPELLVKLVHKGDLQEVLSFSVRQREYDIQRINGVASKFVNPPPEVSERIRSDNRKVKNARKTFRADAYEYLDKLIWPAKGPITGVYGSQRVFNGVPKRPHYGLDIAGPVGQEVVAPLAGQVTLAEDDLYYSGGTVIVDHGRGISSTFIHLSKLHVDVGDYVEQGQLIAEIGATGRVTGPHLDWRMNWHNTRLDPQLLLDSLD